jgi:hypothetical protein
MGVEALLKGCRGGGEAESRLKASEPASTNGSSVSERCGGANQLSRTSKSLSLAAHLLSLRTGRTVKHLRRCYEQTEEVQKCSRKQREKSGKETGRRQQRRRFLELVEVVKSPNTCTAEREGVTVQQERVSRDWRERNEKRGMERRKTHLQPCTCPSRFDTRAPPASGKAFPATRRSPARF